MVKTCVELQRATKPVESWESMIQELTALLPVLLVMLARSPQQAAAQFWAGEDRTEGEWAGCVTCRAQK